MASFGRFLGFLARQGGPIALAVLAQAAPASAQTDIVLAPAAASARAGKWSLVADASAAGGAAMRHADAGAAKVATALANPADYFELTFEAVAGTPYRLWLHGRADRDHWANDSVYVQFSGSVTASGAPSYRIGSTSAAEINLEECSGCGLGGWRWQDNGWGRGVLGPVIYFAASGAQRLRVQTREDGLSIDQMVLSPSTYLTSAPTSVVPAAAAPGDITLRAAAPAARAGAWTIVADAGAAGGAAIRHADAGAAKLSTPLATPVHYFELTFDAVAGTPYRLWLRGKADGDHWANDSVYVQFSGSVTAAGAPAWRIGSTAAAEVNLEECSGCGLSGWVWQDNGWGRDVLGPEIYFATSGPQRMRVQTREDGLAIDQIVLSPSAFLTGSPGPAPAASAPPATEPAPAPAEPAPAPATEPAPVTTPVLLKVLDWNTHHGVGTDGRYDIGRIAEWIARTGANVVSLNEVEKFNGSWGNEDQPARYAALLRTLTGQTWYYEFAQRDGLAKGQGNLILTTFPIEAADSYTLSYSRSVARVQILVNGHRVNVFSTHLDAASSTYRATQMQELTAWASSFAEQRIAAGDFNAWPGAAEIANMTSGYADAWAMAKAAGTAVAYAGNEAGNTRNSRIDYIFHSKGAGRLRLQAMQVFDTRDAGGAMPSDHRPILATYEVK